MLRSCCSSAGHPRKNLPCYLPCSGPAFPAHRDFVSMLGNSFESFPCHGCGRNKPHAFYLNEIVISDSCISDYLFSLLLNRQEPGTLCSSACAKGYQQGAPGGASPNIRSLSLILLFAQLGTTDNHWLNMLHLGQNYTKLMELGTY